MSDRSNNHQTTSPTRNSKYDDWTCLFCQNHNYSFRSICNRCHLQTKEQNAYLTLFYKQQIAFVLETPSQLLLHSNNPCLSAEFFPHVLLLVINNDPWQQQPQRREPNESINIKWINNLIEVFLNYSSYTHTKSSSILMPFVEVVGYLFVFWMNK